MPYSSKSGEPGVFSSIFRFFRSIKTAVVLLLVISALSILATLIPQGKNADYYQEAYGAVGGWFITSLNFDTFFRSFLFIFPSALFAMNLGVCAVDRFAGRIRRKMKKRFGPDILHMGLIVLIIGGIVTFSGRQEGYATLSEGDSVSFPGGYTVSLTSFEFLTYADGMPKDWISTVKVTKDGETQIEEVDIEVNKPLKIGNVKLYQSSYFLKEVLFIRDEGGNEYEVEKDSIIPAGEGAYIFRGIESGDDGKSAAVLDTWLDHEITGRVRMEPGDQLGEYIITEFQQGLSTGLQAVIDPGYQIVFVALFIVIFGLFLTYIQKIGDT